jgi:hypothetical protein
MRYEIVYDCECGVQTKLTLKRPLRVGQILGCLSCGRRFRLTPLTPDAAEKPAHESPDAEAAQVKHDG